VAVLLLLTYRSPFLWLVPLVVVGVGDRVAGVLVGCCPARWAGRRRRRGRHHLGARVRSRHQLRAAARRPLPRRAAQREDRFAAMARALRTTAPAILASGGTVALSLLTLLLADLTSNRGLGFGGAVGVAVAMAVGLVVLPAALVLPGRWLFWPFVPRVGDPTTAERAGVVPARPARVAPPGAGRHRVARPARRPVRWGRSARRPACRSPTPSARRRRRCRASAPSSGRCPPAPPSR
jgi:RND superfamily putative drug exporter